MVTFPYIGSPAPIFDDVARDVAVWPSWTSSESAEHGNFSTYNGDIMGRCMMKWWFDFHVQIHIYMYYIYILNIYVLNIYNILLESDVVDDVDIPFIWVNFITTEPCSPEPWNHFFKGNHPQMAQQFRLVKYHNLPR